MTEKRSAQPSHDGNIACLNRRNCSQVFFVYAGAQGMVEGMGPMAFLQQSGIADRNVAFIRDPHACFFDKGVSDDIPSIEALLDWHKAYLEDNPHITEIYCLGNSMGGFGALLFGYLLAARQVWSLAPGGEWGRQLLADLMVDGNGTTEYDIFYSRQVPEDQAFAESLRACPGVRLALREDHGHLMIRGLLQSGELPRLMRGEAL
ncbi:hypothetical protein LCGC14_2464700 [marine sediment metagenome]|uniref:Alpha/beta hydrolase n=1 Tax=marine sediment metagenome TaxID=412755 RepID=A0A0F9E625_9ZZZZ